MLSADKAFSVHQTRAHNSWSWKHQATSCPPPLHSDRSPAPGRGCVWRGARALIHNTLHNNRLLLGARPGQGRWGAPAGPNLSEPQLLRSRFLLAFGFAQPRLRQDVRLLREPDFSGFKFLGPGAWQGRPEAPQTPQTLPELKSPPALQNKVALINKDCVY